jgi:serine/threonine protein kinase
LLNNGSLKVLNFGTSTFDINDLDYPIEKIEYLAPEQCTISGKVDQRTDVYALGVILFEMLAGSVPLTDTNGTDLLLKQTQETPPPITAFRNDLPNEVDDVLLKALAKNPEIRYQTVEELADELNQIALLVSDSDEDETIVVERVAVPANAVVKPEQTQNNLWKTAFIVLAGVTLLGASFIYLTSGKQTNPSTQIQTDANGSPVQPAPPPTGTMEQTLSNMDSFNPELYTNSNLMPVDGSGYTTPWDRSSNPPPGAPTTGGYGDPYPVYPSNTGPTVYVDPANGSIFMPVENSNRYVVVNPNKSSNVNTPPKKNSNTNTNVPANVTKPSPTPATTNTPPPEAKPTAAPKATVKPAETKPKTTPTPPTATEKRLVSGKQQDTERQK